MRRYIRCHTHISEYGAGPDLAGDNIYTGTAMQEITDHLRRHFLGISTNPLSCNTVISCHNYYRFMLDLRDSFALYSRELHR